MSNIEQFPKTTIADGDGLGYLAKVDSMGNLQVSFGGGGVQENVNIAQVGGAPVVLGQTTSSASVPVVISSDQTALPITFSAASIAINDGTTPSQKLAVDASGKIGINNFPASQTVSGTVAATQGTSPWVENITQIGGASLSLGLNTAANSLPVVLASDSAQQNVTISDGSTPSQKLAVDNTGKIGINNFPTTQPVSGTVTVVQPTASNLKVDLSGTGANATAIKVDGSAVTQPVSAASLPLPSGASTSAKQPALGVAGTASADVITVQGIASMTALKVDGSGVTQPVSGTVSVGNFPATQPVSGAVNIADPGTPSQKLAVDASGRIGVNNFPASQTVTGTVTVQQSTASNLNATVVGTGTFAVQATLAAETTKVIGTVNQGTSPWVNNITQVGGSAVSLGQKTMANSIPTVLASDQTSIPVSISGTIATGPALSRTTQNITATGTANGVLVNVANFTTVQIKISGTYGAPTIQFVYSLASSGTPTDALMVTKQGGTGTLISSDTPGANATAIYSANVSGAQQILIYATVFPSGTMAVEVNETTDPISINQYTQSVQSGAWSVTSNAGTNLNTSLLALESGGNLATLAGGVTASVYQANVKQINGVTPLMGNGTTGTGSQRVTIASDNTAFSVNATLGTETTKVIGTVNIGTSTVGGATPYFASAIKSTVTISSAAGKFISTNLINTDSAPVYLQVFDTTGAVTLGTTVPTFVIPYSCNATAANGMADRGEITVGYTIANGIKAAATTTATGSSTSANGLTGTIGYK